MRNSSRDGELQEELVFTLSCRSKPGTLKRPRVSEGLGPSLPITYLFALATGLQLLVVFLLLLSY